MKNILKIISLAVILILTACGTAQKNGGNEPEAIATTQIPVIDMPTELLTTHQTEASIECTPEVQSTYILNKNTKKFHIISCTSVNRMSEKNKKIFTGNRDEVISAGYSPCLRCNP